MFRVSGCKRQRGATLMEVLVAMSISLVVTASMIALMSNSLRSTARIVQMTKLSDDLRVAMQMMSRDVRRSNYNGNAMLCYSNLNCGADGAVTLAGDVTINDSNTCITFLTDRDHDGDSTENDAGGFRRVVVGGIGAIEMWTGDASPDCSSAAGSAGWVRITDPDSMDIFAFNVDDNFSYLEDVVNNAAGNLLRQRVRKIRMNVQGRLVADNTITRSVEDIISVRTPIIL